MQALVAILVLCILVVILPPLTLLVLRMLFVGAPVVLVGGIIIFICQMLENRSH